MAGIYLHIPFCKSRCIYCDFYSTLFGERQEAYVAALSNELRLRAGYLRQGGLVPPIETVYVGGGTPTTLDARLLERLFTVLYDTYAIDPQAEITLEANPDDLTPQRIKELCRLPVNRLSIGIQTFDSARLRMLRRRHDGGQAMKAVGDCQDAGLENISIDLIYGLPGQTLEEWEADLDQAIALQVQHISAYALIYEENTPLWRMRQEHQVEEAAEELSLDMFNTLMDKLAAAGFEHYEISNFALPERRARHNSSYWKGIPYLGCGPAAHSFDGRDRQWNRPDLDNYIRCVGACLRPEDFQNAPWIEKDELGARERYNERIITSLRTSDGLDLARLEEDFGTEMLRYCLRAAVPHLRNGLLEQEAQKKQAPKGLLRLTRRGLFLSDGVMSDLLYVDD